MHQETPDTPADLPVHEARTLEAALTMAIQYVVARPRTAHEVRQKLGRSGVTEAVATAVIAQLRARGFLDDAAYTRAYVTSRLTHRGYGPQRLRRELQQRGVGRQLVEETVVQSLDTEDILVAARQQAAKRWGRLTREVDLARRRQKVYDFLRRRGFTAAIAQQVLAEVVADPMAY
ncbi:MAG: regulatory protein RecX [Candidatus Tectomicrobia bacterium]|uniref:Regulatory protein RecX n=1 Tax=Tectimicrobiota bacterium TaxID=2528274 RepID=A0A938B1W5_UNCTE|nr:regulatory protein RecX [Candidatus Tectomicrobia bacterium]